MRKMEDYWVFNVSRFIIDYDKNVQALKEKREALEEITEIRTPNYDSPPGTPKRGDCVAAAVEQIEQIEKEVRELEKIVNAYDKVYRYLSKEDKKVLELFAYPVEAVQKMTCYSERQIYRQRSRLKHKFRRYLGV